MEHHRGKRMWVRDLVFLGMVVGGLVLLAGSLFPARNPPSAPPADLRQTQADEFQSVVRQVNLAFHEQWSELKLEPAEPASELALARRLSLALTGSIPSLEDVRRFEAYSGEQRVQWWLAGLLQDRRFADYWAERLVRVYAGTEMGPFIIFRRGRFVSWLSEELMDNRPYDQVVRQMIAGAGLWTDQPATNFVTATIEQSNKNQPNAERLAGKVARAFLGARLDCAQCHNHPFAPWKQQDFQGLAAFFSAVRSGATGIYDGKDEYVRENRKTGEKQVVAPRVPFAEGALPDQGTRRQRLAAWVTDPTNKYFAQATVNRVWGLLFGKPLVEPVDDLATAGAPPRALLLLAEDFTAHGYDLKRLVRVIVATEAFQLDSAADHEVTDAHEKTFAAFPLSRLRPEQVAGSILQAASLKRIDHNIDLLTLIATAVGRGDFVKRYGDAMDDEFEGGGETIPQRLLLMNGNLVKEKTKGALFNAATRIALLAPDDDKAVRTAYLAVLTREPTPRETAHFAGRLAGSKGDRRKDHMEDIFWVLINSTEFSWNH